MSPHKIVPIKAPMSNLDIAFPPAPTFTEKNLPALNGKVYIITGAASGVGFELAKILYAAGGTVYIAARSNARCSGAIEKIKSQVVAGEGGKKLGSLESLVVDLADLRTIKPAAESFLQREGRLDVLVHNAGVMTPPPGSKGALGHDLEMGTNCLGPYLLTLLLEPLLIRTAATEPAFGVRLVWVVSAIQGFRHEEAMQFTKAGIPLILKAPMESYMQTKVGGTWLAAEFAKRLGGHKILSTSVHPGFMPTELQRSWGLAKKLVMKLMKGPIYGAYSELFAGFSPDIGAEHNGGFVTSWGRLAEMPHNVAKGLKLPSEGGNGLAAKFLKYCDGEIGPYL